MTKQTLKTGTQIEMLGTPAAGGFPAVPAEQAHIARWTARCDDGGGPNHVRGRSGWHIVRFHGGGELCVHETGFRVIDNRAA